jgi:P27 family predicted phage terminase small subunit
VQQVDQAILAAYCSTYALFVSVRRKVNASNVTTGGKLNPAARYADSLLKHLRGLLDQLGFTPAARRQILSGTPSQQTLDDLLESDE